MKAYVGNRDDEKSYEFNQIELLCNQNELAILIDTLVKFYEKLEDYKKIKVAQKVSGLPHIHYRDNSVIWKEEDADIVVYVNMDE